MLEQEHIDLICDQIPGGVANIQDIYPLAPLQEGILFHHMLSSPEVGDSYVMPTLLTVSNREQLDKFIKALNAVIQRHDVLRTAVFWDKLPRPLQVVMRDSELPLKHLKLDASLDVVQQLEERIEPGNLWIDLREAPLIRIEIAADPTSEKYYVIINVHHIINDHVGLEILVGELSAYLESENPDLPPAQPYREFIAHTLAQAESGEMEAYFRSRLANINEPTLPFGITDVQVRPDQFLGALTAVDESVAARIYEHCKRLNISPASLFHLAWAVVAGRCSGRDDVVFGTVLSGRLQGTTGADRTVGMFLNTLPIRLSLKETAQASLISAHKELLELIVYEQAPLSAVHSYTNLAGDTPLFTSLLNYRNDFSGPDTSHLELPAANDSIATEPPNEPESAEDIVSLAEGPERTNYPMSVSIDETGDGSFEISAQVINTLDPNRLVQYLRCTVENLIEALENDSDKSLSRLDILPASEKSQILNEFNQSEFIERPAALAHELFESQVSRRPYAVALVYEGQHLTYAELNTRANQLAHYLVEQGVGPDILVGLCLTRSLDLMVGVLGVLKAGGAYVPLDPEYPETRLAFQIEDADLKIVLSQSHLSSISSLSADHTICLDDEIFQQELACLPDTTPAQSNLTNQNLAYVIYTSGTTGHPKGCLLRHEGLVNLALTLVDRLHVGLDSRVLQFSSFGFDASVFEWVMTLCHGASLIIPNQDTQRDPRLLGELVETRQITHATLPPSLLGVLDEEQWQGLKVLVVAGEACSLELARCWQKNRVFINAFGPSEATVCSSMMVFGEDDQHLTIGKPLTNVLHVVVDSFDQIVPVGVAGELLIGGVGLAQGYLNRAELTAEKFIPNPFSNDPESRLYRTGDLVSWHSDGNLEFLGRVDEQVKLRGFRIELSEIEVQLRTHEAVNEAVVMLDRGSSGDGRLIAYVTTERGSDIETGTLREHLKSRLPEYMLPSLYMIIETIPLTVNGKIDRKALPAPDQSALIDAQAAFVAPVGSTESKLAEIWQQLLGVEQVGRNDSFFNLGGHSLLVIRLIAQLQSAGLDTEVREVFDNPILKDLANRIGKNESIQFKAPPNLIPDDCERITPDLLPLVALEQSHIDLIADQVPGGAANIQDIYPLGPLQEGILFHHMLSTPEDGDAYIMTTLLTVSSRTQLDKLIGALNTIIARHDIMRTAVVWDGLPQPVQVVLRDSTLSEQRFSLNASLDSLQQLRDRIEPENLWMDLGKAPLLQLEVAKDPTSEQYFVIVSVHHITTDHIGFEVMMDELEAALESDPRELPKPVPYREFVAHTIALAQSGATETYFRSRFETVDEPTLPFGITDIKVKPGQIDMSSARIEPAIADRIRNHSQHLGISAASFLHLAWGIVVGRASGRDDVVFGTVLSGRLQGTAGADRTVGVFINTLPIRLSLKESVRASLMQAHDELVQLFNHEQTSLTSIRRYSSLTSDAPLFTSFFNFRHDRFVPEAESEPSGDESEPHDDEIVDLGEGRDLTNYPIAMSVDDFGDQGFEIVAQVVNTLDPDRLVAYLSTAAENLVTALDNSAEVPLASIDILPASEQNCLLSEFNQTDVSFPEDALIHEQFESQVERTPDALAVFFDGQELTYGELNAKANQLAHYLIERGIEADSRVGLCLERSFDMVIGIVGILKAGGAWVPLDPEYPETRLRFQLEDADLDIVLTDGSLLSKLPILSDFAVCFDSDAFQRTLCEQPVTNPLHSSLGSRHLAYVLYTSGSTGQPKGVMIEHQALVNRIDWMDREYGITSDDRVLQKTPFSFDVSVWEFVWPLTRGAALVFAEPGGHRDPQYLKEIIRQYGVTIIHFVPSMLALFVDVMDWPVSSLQKIFCSGEALSKELRDRVFAAGATCELHNLYGPTEAAIDVSYWDCALESDCTEIPIGRPISNIQLSVLDQAGRLAPIGVPGELHIGGVGLARGYWNRAELTREKFIQNPFSEDSDSRLYKTGDLTRWLADGNIEYLGRIDHQVKIRGFRIEPGEIEAKLRAHDAVSEAVVILDQTTNGEGRLIAYVTESGSALLQSEQLRDYLVSCVPDYMVPAQFVVLNEIPLSLNGKVDRRALPAPDIELLVREYEAPVNDVERTVSEIWQTMLNIEQVGREDHFFELGGHSLMVIQLIAQLQSKGLNTDVRTVFDHPVLKDLSRSIRSNEQIQFKAPPNLIPGTCERVTPELLPLVDLEQKHIDQITNCIPGGAANIQDIYPLVPLQEGILFHHMLGSPEEGDTYIMPVMLSVPNQSQLDKFVDALNAVVARHDVLRTAVFWDGLPQPVQVVMRECKVALNHVELDATEDALVQLRERIEPENLWIDLGQAPLLQVEIAADPLSSRFFVIINVHHIINDHVALEVLVEELTAHLESDEPELKSPVPYREFVAHMLEQTESGAMDTYFHSRLGDLEEPTVPFGINDIKVPANNILEHVQSVDRQLGKRIRAQVQRLGVGAASIFHLAWALVVGRSSGRDDVVFGTVLSGRLQGTAGADRTLGLFINTLPIRIPLTGSVTACLENTQREIIELVDYEYASLVKVQELSGVPSETPLFTGLLNYRYDQVVSKGDPAELADGHDDEGDENHQIPDDEIVDLEESRERANYPFDLSVDDHGKNGFGLVVQVEKSLDPKVIAQYVHTSIENIIEALEQEPERSIRDINILPADEVKAQLLEFNKSAGVRSNDLVHELFERAVEKEPNATAVIFKNEIVTYEALNRQANQLAHLLMARGVEKESLVGVYMERSVEMVVAILGILKAGGAWVPLEPGYPKARLEFLLKDASPVVVLTQSVLRSTLPETSIDVICLDDPKILYDQDVENPDQHGFNSDQDQLAYVIYTSGSTGEPKGVEVLHRGVVNYLNHAVLNYYHDTTGSVVSTALSFDATVTSLLGPLVCAKSIHLIEQKGSTDEITALGQVLNASKEALVFKITPAHMQALELEFPRDKVVSTVRHQFVIGGEQLNKSQLSPWKTNWLPNSVFINEYGPTETVVGCSTYTVSDVAQLSDDCLKGSKVIPIGQPTLNMQLYVVDANNQLVPQGAVGELLIGGEGVARGYLNREDLTARKFIPNPFYDESNSSHSQRVYRTGDQVRYRADGQLEFVGRVDHQVKLRGFRIELGEIEAQILAHEFISQAAVLVIGEEEADSQLVACVATTVAGEEDRVIDAVREDIKTELPEYMVPSRIVVLASLPLTSSGKVDRSALSDHCVIEAKGSRDFVPPQGATEVMLADIWQTLLKTERIGRQDNFYHLGGHSLLAIRFIAKLKEKNYSLSLASLFKSPTIAAIARELDGEQTAVRNPVLLNDSTNTDANPLFLVNEVSGHVAPYKALADQLESEFPVYGLQLIGTGISLNAFSVKTLASSFIESIREVQPQGPYRVAGWSSGGKIAYEIANQLLGSDDLVDFVGLIDTVRINSSDQEVTEYDVFDELNESVRQVYKINVDLSPLKCFANGNHQTPLIADNVFDDLDRSPDVAIIFERFLEAGLDKREVIEHLNAYHALSVATMQYCVPPLPIDVHLFAATEEHQGDDEADASDDEPDVEDDSDDADELAEQSGLRLEDVLYGQWQSLLGDRVKLNLIGANHETIVRSPHVVTLAEQIVDALLSTTNSDETAANLYSPIVQIQKGRAGCTPLICIPGSAESATCFLPLSQAVDSDMPLIAIQSRGLDPTTVPHTSVESAADFYLAKIREKFPHGPYAILGHSFGGWVAFEIATRLEREGEKVDSLVVVDSEHPLLRANKVCRKTRTDHLVELKEVLEQSTNQDIDWTREDLLSLDGDRQLELLLKTLNGSSNEGSFDLPTVRAIVNVFLTNIDTNYVPGTKFDGPSLLINALQRSDDEDFSIDEVTDAWSTSMSLVKSVSVDGNHMSILKFPLVSRIVEALRKLPTSASAQKDSK